mgnify:CR=1 FL=1
MTTEEKLQHFYDVSMESAREEAQKALEEYRRALDDMFEEHKKEITKMVFDKIEKDRTFLKYGIPINFLKVSKITLVKRTSEIHYVLVIKDINNLKF